MSFISNLLKIRQKNKVFKNKPFFELSDKEKEEIIIKSAKQANKDQRDLVDKYHRICSQRS